MNEKSDLRIIVNRKQNLYYNLPSDVLNNIINSLEEFKVTENEFYKD